MVSSTSERFALRENNVHPLGGETIHRSQHEPEQPTITIPPDFLSTPATTAFFSNAAMVRAVLLQRLHIVANMPTVTRCGCPSGNCADSIASWLQTKANGLHGEVSGSK